MTRFARAKGSKASNERLPNEGTPWHVMKQQLEESLSKHKEPIEKTKSAKELLAAKQDIAENTGTSWAEFENNSAKKRTFTTNKVEKKQKSQLKNDKKNQKESAKKCEDNTKSNKKSFKRNINEAEESVTKVKNKKFKRDENQFGDKSKSKEDQSGSEINNETEATTDKANMKRKKNKQNNSSAMKNNTTNNTSNNANQPQDEKDAFPKRQKRNMRKKKSLNASGPNAPRNNNNNHSNVQNNTTSSENESKGNNHVANRFNKNFANKSRGFENGPNKFGVKKFDTQKKRKPPKIRDDKEHKRRKPDLGPTKIVINGVEVELVKFDGFPVRKEDADRLKDLKQKMIMKGIPKKDIDVAMKLERRKAEKALARIRKCVCFHCRKAGHNLSDCPELGSEQAGTGICFKCGSTEHTHFECKVAKPTEFRYATCFICREQGHIAKQCPDNPKGVYPQGGSCNICGDVTHLKKDCPDLIKEKEESSITVNTIANGNLESLDGNVMNTIEGKDGKKPKKIVKF